MTAKDQNNYENRELQKNEKMLINIKMNENELVRPMMVSVSCSTDENATQKRAEKRKNIRETIT